MRMVSAAIMAAVLVCALAASNAAAADPAPAPTPPGILSADEVKKLAAAGQYPDALKALIRILELKGPAAAGYDRHEMLMLRADCQLHIKQNAAAIDTLEAARKEAVVVANDDHAMEASALSMLIKASPGGTYTPTTGTMRKGIPVADKTLRKAAFDAMLADQLAMVTQKVKVAKASNQLKPLAEAAQLVVNLRPVEKASAGDNAQTDKILSDLAAQTLKMITAASDDLANDAKRIADSANRLVTENVAVTDSAGRSYLTQQTHRAGLRGNDAATLKNIINETGKLIGAANELAQFFASGDPAPFRAVAAKAAATKAGATTTLNDDYGSNLR